MFNKQVNLSGKFYKLAYESKNQIYKSLPENFRDFVYFLVPGLYYKNWGTKYMKDNIDIIQKLGLNFKQLSLESDTVEENARVIKDYIIEHITKNPSKKIIIIGHSKGAVDAGTAIAKYNLYKYIHSFISLQAPWFGTPIVNEEDFGLIKYFNSIVSLISNANKEALWDMKYERRYEMLHKYPYDSSKIKTISVISTINNNSSLFYLIPNTIMKTKFNTVSDGIVRSEDALIPGSDYIYINDLAHNESVITNYKNFESIYPENLTYALIVLSI